jgi:hypothetical protein
MWRTILGIVVGLLAWLVVVSLIDRGLRLWLPGYAAAEPLLQFTFAMKIARLSMAAVTSLVAGAAIRVAAPQSRYAPWIVGFAVLAAFLPAHIHLWDRFPIWYHLSFLLPLVPLVAIGAALWPRRKTAATA